MTSIGKKAIMALTGLALFGFVMMHMIGNLQIFLGQDALNGYAEFLEDTGELLWVARAVLLSCLVLHVTTAVMLSRENRAARPVRYTHEGTVQASYASRTMLMSGLIVFAFIIYHLLHFTLGKVHPQYAALHEILDSKGREDVYSMVVASFHNVWISAAYVGAMIPLCMHLSHGFQSLFQSLGLNHSKYTPLIRKASLVFSLLIFAGNTSIPLACLFDLVKIPIKGA
jgi:succinate dehydrogenase / fumarate reductase cytochrome b subunit